MEDMLRDWNELAYSHGGVVTRLVPAVLIRVWVLVALVPMTAKMS
jgi:hypothetical protein